MRQRVLTAVIGIPLLLLLVYLGSWYFFALCFLASAIALYEFHGFTKGLGADISLFLLEAGGLLAFLTAYFMGRSQLNSAYFIVLIILLLIIEMFRSRSILKNGSLLLLGTFYGGVLFAFLPLLRHLGVGYLILLLLVTWGSDSFAFFVGIKFGKHKMWPVVSPKKSWEGSIGGLLGGLAGGLVTSLLGFVLLKDGLIAGLVGSVFAQIGDFMESAMKRECQVKDSGYILPGHGGILDRVDSLIILAPVLYLTLQILA